MGGWELGREENYRKMHHLLALGNSKHWDSRKYKCPELYVMPLIFETYGCCHNKVKRKCLPCKKKMYMSVICRVIQNCLLLLFPAYNRGYPLEAGREVALGPNPTQPNIK